MNAELLVSTILILTSSVQAAARESPPQAQRAAISCKNSFPSLLIAREEALNSTQPIDVSLATRELNKSNINSFEKCVKMFYRVHYYPKTAQVTDRAGFLLLSIGTLRWDQIPHAFDRDFPTFRAKLGDDGKLILKEAYLKAASKRAEGPAPVQSQELIPSGSAVVR